MAVLFTPPTAPGRPYALRRDRPYSSLFRFYGGIPTGINVFLLAGDVVTTAEPADPADVVRTFHGGHIHTVDETEAAALTAAGYTANLSEVEDAATPVGLQGSTLPWSNDLQYVDHSQMPDEELGTGLSGSMYAPVGNPDATPVEGLQGTTLTWDPNLDPIVGGFAHYGGGTYGEGYYGGSA